MCWLLLVCAIILWFTRRHLGLRRQIALARKLKSSLTCYPVFGHILSFLGSSEDRMKIFKICGRDAIENGGMSKFWHPAQLIVCIADPVVVDAIMNTCLEKHEYILSIMKFVIGEAGAIAPDPIWRSRRKLMAPTFNMNNLVMYTEIFSKKSFIMADALRKEVGKGAFSFWNYVTTYAMESVCETTLGIPMDSQKKIGTHEMLNAVGELCKMAAQIICQPWLRYEWIHKWFPQYKTALKHKKIIMDFVFQIIQDKRMLILQNGGTQSQNGTIKKTSYLDHVLQNDDCLSDQALLDESTILMIAGFESSSVSVSFTMLLLSQRPDIQDKVHKELDEVLGTTERRVTYKDLHQLKYLEAVIKESLRLYPPIPMVIRQIDRDILLPSGLTLVDGCAALINIWAINRNPEYWGPDADEFRPERFLEAPLKHPAAFASFSYGMRGCIGMQYGMMSLKTNLATTLHRYQVLPASEKSGEIKTKFEILLIDVDKFNVRLERRNRP